MKIPSLRWQPLVLTLLVAGTTISLAWSIFANLGSDDRFMPHAHCFLMKRDLILLHGISDFLIGVSYVAISATLTYLVWRARREIPFHWMMLAFATFIIACGATHFMEVWTLEAATPPYWLAGNMKLVTALASVATAFLLPPLVPSIRRLLEEARLSGERHREIERTNTVLAAANDRITQLDQLKTNFFANISHELRTPLTLIFGPIDRLLESGRLDLALRHELQVVRRNALLLHRHVNDLLDVSKLEAGKMQLRFMEVDLPHLARLVSSYFSSSGTREMDVTVEGPDSLLIQADPEKLQRILLNLLSNAFKFSPAGGAIRLIIQPTEDEVCIRVHDSGPGVPVHLRDHIFERFAQGTQKTLRGGAGTGLGLSIVKEFVELHHGRVTVDDAPGGGAAFIVCLPRRAPDDAVIEDAEPLDGGVYRRRSTDAWSLLPVPHPEPAQLATAAVESHGKPLVLIAEDNAEMSEHIARTLGGDYQIITAANGRIALDLAAQQTPDLIVTDLMMPEMTGDELMSKLREIPRLASVPVILLTARADEEMKLNLLGSGAQDYVVKPFGIEELRARVRNQVISKQVRDTLQTELASQEQNLASLAKEITVRARELERAKRTAEAANRAKDHFLAVLSHELRTPLTPALALATNLHEHPPTDDPAELRRCLSIIRRNIELEARLIDDLLDLTRIARGKIQLHLATVDVHQSIQHAVEMCDSDRMKRGSQLQLSLAAERHYIRGDAPRLLQVIWNLLLNAIKFTPADGQVTIRTFNRGAARLAIEVGDTGMGIPAELLPKMFEPFEQGERAASRQHGGLGLGLAVAKGLVTAHGGTITAASEGPGLGATFTAEFNTAEAPPRPIPTPLDPETSRAPSATRCAILLVEDHDDTRDAMARLLSHWGYEVTTAATMAEALVKRSERSFDLLISDLGLPDGVGTDLIRELQRLGPMIGIAVSGFGMEDDVRRSREAGFSEHLVKPVNPQRLQTVLEHLAPRQAPRDA